MKAKLILAIGMCITAGTSLADTEHAESHEEVNSSVGPDKGITEADEHDGVKLSSEAIKNFELKTQILSGAAPWEIPSSAILTAGEEVNIYRLRNGFYKRIDFNLISKSGSSLKVNSKDLVKGDAVVMTGVGFLRTAEITAFGGAPEGHSH
ncbi:hypothetical protein [Bdellovibrio svalbardensis]|uniref:Uncharacterized protein n=1 Tax=Bdellovibrio svalbardensis TaxID=2972972 RepID=A0ABT6DKX7_9BACT|nr:hypothetical protein [Bdellovibrio svalbardensis]MDG0815763.1 hypothetical protein [Bdellovibrio svalbardensis]